MDAKKIQELQMIEQNLQGILFQKQAFQLEASETNSALKELGKAGEDVFKIIGQLMIRTDKSKTKQELENKQKILELRLKSLDKQENSLSEQLETIRNELLDSQKTK